MATVKCDFRCDLTKPIKVEYLDGNIFTMDNGGNTINVYCYEGEEPATLGGSVSANVIRPDGTTVPVSGAIDGNKAYVILPQAAYAVPGHVTIIIKVTQSTTVTTIAAIVANNMLSSTDTIVDPGTIIPSVQDLIAQIETAVGSIPADYSALLATLAADYSSSKNYAVGDYAWQAGVLKRCIVPITTAETYTAAHWTNAVLGDDLSALKSALYDSAFEVITSVPEKAARSGYGVNSAGRYSTASNSVGGYGNNTEGRVVLYARAGSTVKAKEGYKLTIAVWDDLPITTTQGTAHRHDFVDITSGNTYTLTSDGYFVFGVSYSGGGAIPTGVTPAQFANAGMEIVLYSTGAIDVAVENRTGLAMVGNSIATMFPPVSVLKDCIVFSKNVCKNTGYTDGYYIKPDGTTAANASYKVSDYFLVEPNTQYYLTNSNSTIVFYDANKNYIIGWDKSASTTVVTSPANACFARHSTNATPALWNVSKGTSTIDTPYFEPYMASGDTASPYWKGEFNFSKPDARDWYECECLKEDVNAFDFHLGTDTAHTGTQYADVISKFDDLVSDAEPGYITKTAIGTGSGTDINGNQYTLYEYAFVPREYTENDATKKHPKILIDCAIHGFEKNSTFGFFSLLYDVVHNWKKNAFLSALRNFVEIRIVPVSNPYGFDNNIRNNANGVNLNRNFPAENWESGTGINYGGESPLDQPEAAALAEWMQDNSDMWLYLNVHTNGHYSADGYAEANPLMPYSNIDDAYYKKMYNAFKRQIERQTAYLPGEFSFLTPTQAQFIGKIQDMETSGSGYADQYVCWYLKSALAFTLEGCNQIEINEVNYGYSHGTIKMNAEMFGNVIAQMFYEYLA